MRSLIIGGSGLALLVLAAAIYIRVNPLPSNSFSDRPGPNQIGRHLLKGGIKYVIYLPTDVREKLNELEHIASSTPRTKIVKRDNSHVVAVTRSQVFGFPDVNVLWIDGNNLHIFAHLVYGRSDFGVNAKRIDHWLKTVEIELKDVPNDQAD